MPFSPFILGASLLKPKTRKKGNCPDYQGATGEPSLKLRALSSQGSFKGSTSDQQRVKGLEGGVLIGSD